MPRSVKINIETPKVLAIDDRILQVRRNILGGIILNVLV